ncbi:MAG: hypothetical protein N2258_01000 [Brevinematales bacterium]|nr:hypothetical protein [Brevinematales bacterium]
MPELKILAGKFNLSKRGSAEEIIKRILKKPGAEKDIDNFIKQKYMERKTIEKQKLNISDEELKKELMKVESFSWGVVQGQLDQKIQNEYVRKFVRYQDLICKVKGKLHKEITNYVICTWFNHWTTVLIEEHISNHENVIPTIKNVKGIDIFFDGQPFDLKVTYLPQGYDLGKAIKNPKDLAKWMYENQGAQRFGADNRIFVILLDESNPDESWKIKRDFDLVFNQIDNFFNNEKISEKDKVVFNFGRKTYTALAKVLIIKK